MSKTEIRSLTGLRGIAALYVALYHYLRFLPVDFTGRWTYAIVMHGYLSVDLFFVLSAFVLSLSNQFQSSFNIATYKRFMLKRWVRIYPAYFIIVIVGYRWLYVLPNRLPNFLISLSLLNLAFNKPVLFLHLWSLQAEWIMYAVFPFLLVAVAKMGSSVNNIILFLAGIGLYIISIYASGQKMTGDYSLDVFEGHAALIRCFAGYCFGLIAVNIYQGKAKAFFTNGKVLYTVAGLLAGLLFFPQADILVTILFIPLMVGIAGSSSLISGFLHSKVVYFLGVISYPLYLIHYILLWRVERIASVLSKWHLANTTLAVYLFLIVFLAAAFTFCIEKPLVAYLSDRLIKPLGKRAS